MSTVINLGNEVIVSDPYYSIPTWGQKIIKNVKPGEYRIYCKKINLDGWGNRVSMLLVVHSDHEFDNLKWRRDGTRGTIKVNSGQAGIFDLSNYSGFPENMEQGIEDTFQKDRITDKNGGGWCIKIRSHTLGDKQWSQYKYGVISSSGIGDGAYDLYMSRVNRTVVAIAIEFLIEEELFVDFNWYKDHTNDPGRNSSMEPGNGIG